MADKAIGDLPAAGALYDDSLLVVEQQSEARSIRGSLVKQYAKESVGPEAERAEKAADRAEQAAQGAADNAADNVAGLLSGYVDDTHSARDDAAKSRDAAAESAKDAADVALRPPILKAGNDHWWIWSTEANDYVDSGIDAGVSLDVVEETITGAAGSKAAVENLGTPTDPRLRFTIPQGVKGDAATIKVGAVATGSPGTMASVTNSGTLNDAVLEFTIPRGAVGETGPQGAVGPAGPQGKEGPQGI